MTAAVDTRLLARLEAFIVSLSMVRQLLKRLGRKKDKAINRTSIAKKSTG